MPEINSKLVPQKEDIKDAPYFLVNRHYLSSIKPDDLDEYLIKLNESERREYEAEASTIFNNPVFKREIKYLLGQQVLFISNESGNWEQVLLGRGTINGIGLIEDRFNLLNSRHLENIGPSKEAVDKFGLLPS